MKQYRKRVTAVFAAVMAVLLLAAGGCAAPKHEGFAIYLTRDEIPPAQMPVLSHFEIAERPLIGVGDIISYDRRNHQMALTKDAFERISGLQVPVRGRSFAVCVDRQPVYWGAFWVAYSSMSFDGVTIWKPLGTEEASVIRLELGYPGASFYRGEDPRNSAVVLKSLGEAGKLTAGSAADGLPHSMKGYELYSWPEGENWYFTLVTGTNRNKTLEEIVSPESVVSADGWVHLRVTGVAAINAVLGRLPRDESVIWLAGLRPDPRPEPPASAESAIALPPEPVVDAVKAHAADLGLDFNVLTP
jgi:hypothetical protein